MKNKEKNEIIDKKNLKFYYSYNMRLLINAFLFIILFIVAITFILKTFILKEAREINYSERSNLDYKVYLKENKFYDEKFLPKDMLYVANLIDNIKIDFNYNFLIKEKLDLIFEYEIIGKLIIQDDSSEKTYFEKDYKLLDVKTINLEDRKDLKINEIADIDYNKFNSLSNSFKTSYGLNTKSKLMVYFRIKKKSSDKNNGELLINNNSNSMIVTIPLSEKAVNISLDYKNINNESRVLDNSSLKLGNVIYLVVSILSCVLCFIFLIRFLRLFRLNFSSKNLYDKYIMKLLNEYDRLIVETTSSPIKTEEDKSKIVNIEKFTELLDVRDNLKLPIMYYIVTEHEKCQFYIRNSDSIYLLTIKRVDIEAENEKK